jgi:ADP-ribose pyrophosphatase YjhB (NUDIX family)
MEIREAIAFLEGQVDDRSVGLPEELFLFVSRLTPMVNVDLLIRDEKGRILLAWRDDSFAREGWHVPGGIIRFKERLEQRIMKVAETEIGAAVGYDPVPLAINQVIIPGRDTRGHFISLLYRCFLSGSYVPMNEGRSPADPGYLKWHDACPSNLVEVLEMYRPFMGSPGPGEPSTGPGSGAAANKAAKGKK